MNDLVWIVDEGIIQNTKYSNLYKVIENLGMECIIMNSKILMHTNIDTLFDRDTSPAIIYSTLNNARKLSTYFGYYCDEKTLAYSYYTAHLHKFTKKFLNHDGIFGTYADFKENYNKYRYYLSPNGTLLNRMFVKPNSCFKLFTGYTINFNDIRYELNCLERLVNPESLLFFATPKIVKDEVRFVIVDGKVVDGSRYSISNIENDEKTISDNLVQDQIFPKEYWDFAQEVAEYTWQPDKAYTLDLCTHDNEIKIVEINSFSTAGWYACDPEKIVKAVSDMTLKLWKEQYD